MKTLIRHIIIFLSLFMIVMPIEQSAMASKATVEISENATDVRQMGETKAIGEHTNAHEGPHIPGPKGDIIPGWSIAGMHITNTIFSTWIFM
jgi:hypothetical protein